MSNNNNGSVFGNWNEFNCAATKIRDALRLRSLGATVSLLSADTGLSVAQTSEALARLTNDRHGRIVSCSPRGVWTLV